PTPQLYTLSLHDALPIYTPQVRNPMPPDVQLLEVPAANGLVLTDVRGMTLYRFEGTEKDLSPTLKNKLPLYAAALAEGNGAFGRSEEHTSELQSRENLVC